MIKRLLLLVLLIKLPGFALSQGKWQLVRDQDGIKVYTRRLTSEKFKEVRATFQVKGSEDQLIRLLQNIPIYKDWSYGTKRTFLISRKGRDSLIYYSEIELPWPLSNRDLVVELTFKRDTAARLLHIQAKNLPGIVPPGPRLVRVPFSLAEWNVKVLPNNILDIEYTLRTDPGGALPAWLVNMAATTGPYNSFQKLKALLDNEKKR
jgi:hypothetical protein